VVLFFWAEPQVLRPPRVRDVHSHNVLCSFFALFLLGFCWFCFVLFCFVSFWGNADISGATDGLSDVTEESVGRVLREIEDDLPPMVRTTDLPSVVESSSRLPAVREAEIDSTPYPRCEVCRGFGKDLLRPSGKCAHCERVEAEQASKVDSDPFRRCSRCRGFGLHLVQANGMCAHCTRLS
jgi:hypothetical protein